jgi:DNA-binding MarR family transcriptional regulator
MDRELKTQYIQALFRLRRMETDTAATIPNVNMTELHVMAGISKNMFGDDNSVDLSKIHNEIFVTKAAVSKMFTSLERKGYIIRETDKANRRRITVELTESGEKVLKEAIFQTEQTLDKIISRFGEDNMRQFISLLGQLSDVRDEVMRESGIEL